MKANSSLSIMKRVYLSNLKLQYNPTFLYCYETMHTLIVSGFFVSHPLQKHICEHYLWNKDDILATYPEPVTENTYKVNMTRINAAISEKLQGHNIAFLLNPNDSSTQEEAEEFKEFIDQIYFLYKSKIEMVCINTFQKYLKKPNLNSYDLRECINELNMMQMFSDKNIDAFIQKFADLDKIAYIGTVLDNKDNMYDKELIIVRKLMGDSLNDKEHKEAMKDLQRFTKERQSAEKEKIKENITNSIPKPSNIKKAKEKIEIEVKPEINSVEDTPRYKEGTAEQQKMLRDLVTLINRKSYPKTLVYQEYDKDVKETLDLFYNQIGKSMTVKEVQQYLLRDYSYKCFIEYLKEKTEFDIEKGRD